MVYQTRQECLTHKFSSAGGVGWDDGLGVDETKGDDMHGTTTASPGNTKPVGLEDILDAMRKLAALPNNDQWIVIDPQGRMYKGKVEEVLPVLAKAHPLLKRPLSFGTMSPELTPNAKLSGAATAASKEERSDD